MLTMSIGDPHAPFIDWKCARWLAGIAHDYKPDLVIVHGDTTDGYRWSRFRKNPEALSASAEWDATVTALRRFHDMFDESLPFVILRGNHDERILAQAFEVDIPEKLVKHISEFIPFENWTWHRFNEPFVVDRVKYMHGHEMGGKANDKAARIGRSVVQGHDHRGYLEYVPTSDHQVWGMSVGTIKDSLSYAAEYRQRNPLRNWMGCGLITDGVPHLEPYKRPRIR